MDMEKVTVAWSLGLALKPPDKFSITKTRRQPMRSSSGQSSMRRDGDDIASKKVNIICYLGIPKLGGPLMVVLVCFAQEIGTYL